ncbi:MAG: hypothetical protein GC131_08620 [Alphaproteobacteria bacterium]|nr:hypothetical protein [Alphaproteobacteria bacterium]
MRPIRAKPGIGHGARRRLIICASAATGRVTGKATAIPEACGARGPSPIGSLAVTPEGAALAYRRLTERFYEKYGDYVSPHLLMYAQPLIQHVQNLNNTDAWVALLSDGFKKLVQGGAQIVWMPANTSHLVMDRVDTGKATFINMVDSAVNHLQHTKGKPLVLGTTLSMSDRLYFKDKERLHHCIKPNDQEQEKINTIIIKEMVLGKLSPKSKDYIKRLVANYKANNAVTSVFFACTELPCFFNSQDFGLLVDDCVEAVVNQIVSIKPLT